MTIRRDLIPPAAAAVVRRIEYADLSGLTQSAFSGEDLLTVAESAGWTLQGTRTGGTTGRAIYDLPTRLSGDLIDERGGVRCWMEIDRPSATIAHYVGVYAGFFGDDATLGLPGAALGRSPQFGSSARGYVARAVLRRTGPATVETPAGNPNVFDNVSDSMGGETAVAEIVIGTAPSGTAPPLAGFTVLEPQGTADTDILDWDTPADPVRLPAKQTLGAARGVVVSDPDPWTGGTTRVASGDPVVRLSTAIPNTSTTATGRFRWLFELPYARGLLSWNEANP